MRMVYIPLIVALLSTLAVAGGINYPPGRQTIGGGSAATISAGTTNFSVTSSAATEANRVHLAAKAGTFRNLHVFQTAAPGAGNNVVHTWRVNAADTLITCTIADTATSCSDLVNTSTIDAGQSYSLKSVTSASAASTLLSFGIQLDRN